MRKESTKIVSFFFWVFEETVKCFHYLYVYLKRRREILLFFFQVAVREGRSL